MRGAQAVDGVTPIRVSARVMNVGHVAGTDVAQLYLGMPATTSEPPRIRVGFQCVALVPGQPKGVDFHIAPREEWGWGRGGWSETAGTYRAYAGDSSALADLPLTARCSMTRSAGGWQVLVSARRPSSRAPAPPRASRSVPAVMRRYMG